MQMNACFFTPSLQSRLEPFLWHVTLIPVHVDALHIDDTLVMIAYAERRRASDVADDFVIYRHRQSGTPGCDVVGGAARCLRYDMFITCLCCSRT
jgi:hypothetical protein